MGCRRDSRSHVMLVTPPTLRPALSSSQDDDIVESRSTRRLGAALLGFSRPPTPFVTPELSLSRQSRVALPTRRDNTRRSTTVARVHSSSSSLSMLTEAGRKQPDQASSYPRNSSDDSTDVSALFFPVNFLEPTTPETFLELDPAGFITYSSGGGATKGSCASSSFGRTSKTQSDCWAKLEPSREPCTDEIPWPDLVFWLGNVSTGEVVCSCAQCSGHRAMRQRQRRYSPYEQHMQIQMQQQHRRRVSSRVPVINLPRIEGVN